MPANDADSPIVDFFPDGLPQLMSEHLDAVMNDAIERGLSVGQIYELLCDERARQFRDDPRFQERVHSEMESAGVTAPVMSLRSYGSTDRYSWDATIRDLRRMQVYFDSADWLSKVRSPDDMWGDGVNILLEVQNTNALGTLEDYKSGAHLDRIEQLHDYGLRAVQLTYNRRNLVGDGCTERVDAGLSEYGVEVVEKLNELNMIVDISHCGKETTLDTIELSEAPPAFTHTACQALHDHDRGKSDEELEAISEINGYVGIVGVPDFLGLSRDIDAMMKHIQHAVDIAGADKVGIGTDWAAVWTKDLPEPLRDRMAELYRQDNFEQDENEGAQFSIGATLPPLERYGDWQLIPEALTQHGFSEREVRQICGENFVEHFERIR